MVLSLPFPLLPGEACADRPYLSFAGASLGALFGEYLSHMRFRRISSAEIDLARKRNLSSNSQKNH